MLKKFLPLLSDTAVYGLSSAVSQLVGFLLLPLYTSHLTPADYGILAMLGIVTTLFGPLANLGMTNALLRKTIVERDEDQRNAAFATGLCAIVTSSFLLVACGTVFAEPITQLLIDEPGATYLTQLTLLSGAATSLGAVPLTILRAKRFVKTIAITNLTKLLISLSTTIWLIVVERQGVLGVVLGTLISNVLTGFAQLILVLRLVHWSLSLRALRKMLAYGIPYVPQNLLTLMLAISVQYVARRLLGVEAMGIYNVAEKFTYPLVLVVTSFQSAWAAHKLEIFGHDSTAADTFASVFTQYVVVTTHLWLGVSIWGPELLLAMTPTAYHSGALLIPTIALIPVSHGLYFMMGTGLGLTENTKLYPLAGFSGLVVAAASAIPLIHTCGIAGAAVAISLGWLVMAVTVRIVSRHYFPINYNWKLTAMLFAPAVLSVGCTNAYHYLGWPSSARLLLALASTLAYPAVAFFVLRSSSVAITGVGTVQNLEANS